MRKPGESVRLPLFLSVSNTFIAFITDGKGCIVGCNKLFTQHFGGSNGLNVNKVFADNSFDGFAGHIQSITEASPSFTINSTQSCAVNWEIARLDEAHFICTGVMARQVQNDVGEHHQNPLSVFFDNSPALMWATDKEGRLQMMNKRYREHTGFTDAQIGKSIWDIYPKDMAGQFKKNDDIVLQTNKLLEIEEISVDKSGTKRNYVVYKFPLKTQDNSTLVAGCSIDVTDVLEKNSQLLFQSHLLDSIEQAVYILDTDTKVIYWSKYAEKLFGWKKSEILHKQISVLTPTGILDDSIISKLRNGQGWDGERELKRKDGTTVQVHTTKSPVIDSEGNISAFIGIAKDISETKTVHKKLVKQNNQFRQIARLQSHAVRRPLANMLGLIDLIQYYSDKNEQEEVMYMISLLKQSSEDLDDIIRRIVLKAGVYFDPALKIA